MNYFYEYRQRGEEIGSLVLCHLPSGGVSPAQPQAASTLHSPNQKDLQTVSSSARITHSLTQTRLIPCYPEIPLLTSRTEPVTLQLAVN